MKKEDRRDLKIFIVITFCKIFLKKEDRRDLRIFNIIFFEEDNILIEDDSKYS